MKTSVVIGVLTAGLTTVVAGLGAGAGPAVGAVGGPVSDVAATYTPSIATSGTDGTVEQVRQMVQCGSTVYAVGTFSQISQGGTVSTRNNAFSYSATDGVLTSWNPDVNGEVNSVALSPDCSTAYLGGSFSTVGGAAATNIAAVSTVSGAVVPGFVASANKAVDTVVRTPLGHLLVGGHFTLFNGSAAHKFLTSVNPATGSDDGYVNLGISGNYVFTDSGGRASVANATQVYNTSLSPDGTKLLGMGVFTSVGGQSRRQIFMADLKAGGVTVNPWTSTEFMDNCTPGQPFWLRDAAWSPDGSKVYTAATGYKPATGLGSKTTDPRAGLCDSAAAFPSTAGSVKHLWVNYTGCDSLYSVAADSTTVYFGGHERWASNPVGCDAAGAGAVAAPGMVGLSPTTGAVVSNPTRGKGLGADDMFVTSAGLWTSSDNGYGANACGKTATGASATGHAGICFLPY